MMECIVGAFGAMFRVSDIPFDRDMKLWEKVICDTWCGKSECGTKMSEVHIHLRLLFDRKHQLAGCYVLAHCVHFC